MTPSTDRNARGRRLRMSGIAAATAAALVSGIWLTSSTPATASVDQTASTLDTALTTGSDASSGDRAQLRDDLKATRELDGQARADAMQKIRADAKAGNYGPRVEKRADRRSDRHAAVLALLPDELQADLTTMRTADGDDRKAQRDNIREKALAGGYGENVQDAAEVLKDRWTD